MSAKTLTCQVTDVEDLNPDVFGITLQGRPEAMSHAPGQYLELGLDDHTWVPFSIASAERGDGRLELHIQHWPERTNSARLRECTHTRHSHTPRPALCSFSPPLAKHSQIRNPPHSRACSNCR